MTLAAFLRHLGFALGLILLSAAIVRVMIAVRVMDTPEARKAHTRPTPKGGGVGIVLTFLIGIAVLYRYAAFARLADPYFLGVIEASLAIAVVAFLDDLFDWPFIVKLAAQLLATLVAVASGLYVLDLNLPYMGGRPVGWIGVVITVAWVHVHHQRDEFHRRAERSGQRRLADRVPVPGLHCGAAWRLVRLRCLWTAGERACSGSCRSISPGRASSWATSAASSAASCWRCWRWWPAGSRAWNSPSC